MPWLAGTGVDADVVMSSRVRLARNLVVPGRGGEGLKFPARSSREERAEVLALVKARILEALAGQVTWVDLHQAKVTDRHLLVERHLISKQHARGRAGEVIPESATPAAMAAALHGDSAGRSELDPRGVAFSVPDERLSIMVNEEDHLRIQHVDPGLSLAEAWREADRVDDLLEDALDFAYAPRFGYLTACPTNCGSGLRMSVMLHLPGLKLTGDIDKVKRAATDMNLAVRGFYGEGSDAIGDFYQLSNQTTLGKPERVILHELAQEILPQVIEYERLARRTLMAKRRSALEDQVFRALGTLTHARLISTEEAMGALSLVRLGVMLDLVRLRGREEDHRLVNHLMLLVQPAHLQRIAQRELDQDQRRTVRAEMIRTRLGK
ncbi:MAG: protein arginine kinase [Planctomycetota bacterium]|nr:protein arginine kinase [Planctomycetota bacterium]